MAIPRRADCERTVVTMSYTNQRKAYGETLVALGAENEKIVALEADLGNSTMSRLFQQAYPERYFEMGIAEANMTSVAAGLAQTGFIPVTHSFAVFAGGRAYDQLRQTIAIGKLNVKVCGSSAGCSDFGDGATHQSVEDIAIMRAIPNMTILCPVDANETVRAVKAMIGMEGPCYIRINRNDYDNVTAENAPFEIGVPTVLREGGDVTVFAIGYMAARAVKAADALAGELSVKVVNVSTLKPLREDALADLARGCRGVVTAEEHSVVGGLGSIVCQALRGSGLPVELVGIEDVFGCSAHSYDEILGCLGLTQEHIETAIRCAAGSAN